MNNKEYKEILHGLPGKVIHPYHRAVLTDEELDILYADNEEKKQAYIKAHLSKEDIDVISSEDRLICAIVKSILDDKEKAEARIKSFDRFVPRNPLKYYQNLIEWVKTEECILEKMLGRKPTRDEMNADFKKYWNGHRHRPILVLKHPEDFYDRGG